MGGIILLLGLLVLAVYLYVQHMRALEDAEAEINKKQVKSQVPGDLSNQQRDLGFSLKPDQVITEQRIKEPEHESRS